MSKKKKISKVRLPYKKQKIQLLAQKILGRGLTKIEFQKLTSWTQSYLGSFNDGNCCKATKEDAVIDYIQEIWYNREVKEGRVNPKEWISFPALTNLGRYLKILRGEIK